LKNIYGKNRWILPIFSNTANTFHEGNGEKREEKERLKTVTVLFMDGR